MRPPSGPTPLPAGAAPGASNPQAQASAGPLRRRRGRGRRGQAGTRAAGALGKGLLGIYLSVLVLLPVAALLAKAGSGGTGAFWREVTGPEAQAAIELTLAISAIVVVVNAIFGTLIAWVLVRDEFPGKRIVNALIDLPFALPTIVAGIVLLALYGNRARSASMSRSRAPRRAGAGVRDAAVRGPVGAAGADRARPRDGGGRRVAGRRGRRRSAPDRAADPDPGDRLGGRAGFARAVGEFGSVVLIAGNLPFKTEVGSQYVFGQISDENLPAPRPCRSCCWQRRCSCWARWRSCSRRRSRHVL